MAILPGDIYFETHAQHHWKNQTCPIFNMNCRCKSNMDLNIVLGSESDKFDFVIISMSFPPPFALLLSLIRAETDGGFSNIRHAPSLLPPTGAAVNTPNVFYFLTQPTKHGERGQMNLKTSITAWSTPPPTAKSEAAPFHITTHTSLGPYPNQCTEDIFLQ